MKKIIGLMLFVSSQAYAAELHANFKGGTVVIFDTICKVDEISNEYPNKGYITYDSGEVHLACWRKADIKKSNHIPQLTIVEKIKFNDYDIRIVNSSDFKIKK